MAFINEILGTIGDNCLDYKLTLLGDCGVICEGFRSIIKFSATELVLRLGRTIIHIEGNDFVIGELAKGYINILGKVDSIKKLDLGAKE